MNGWLQMFDRTNGRYQAEHGFGVLVAASDLASGSYVGRGLYHELFRDHEWLYISRVTAIPDGKVELEYLEQNETSQPKKSEGTVTTEISEKRVTRRVLTFANGDKILISADPVARPKGRRVVTTIVRTEEPLADE
jgi:hypothetical protein